MARRLTVVVDVNAQPSLDALADAQARAGVKVAEGHIVTAVERPAYRGHGWPTAWVWVCSCTGESRSAYRSAADTIRLGLRDADPHPEVDDA